MKKLAWLLALLMLIPAASFAAEGVPEDVVTQIHGLLTEVYGYTQEEALTFNVRLSEEDGANWYIHFFLHPDWVYTATISKEDRRFVDSYTPFTTSDSYKAPENIVRGVLHAIAENKWFETWDADSKAALREKIDWYGDIRINGSMQSGLASADYTPAQALEDFFLSCYGDAALWTKEVRQWRDQVFYIFGVEQGQTVFAMPQGISTRTESVLNGRAEAEMTEFAGEVPAALLDAFSVPRLAGWTCLAGAYQVGNRFGMDDAYTGTGLAAFARDQDRLLVMLIQEAKTQAWTVVPVSRTALLEDRALYITCESKRNRMTICYPISDTEQESFQCGIRFLMTAGNDKKPICELLEYRYTNLAGNENFVVDSGTNGAYTGWYSVTTIKDGKQTVAQYPALAPSYMEYIDASAFPRTGEACKTAAAESPAIPEGYGLSMYVHLRADTSSHSTDLGTYLRGTLVEILDTLPGTAFPWYKVRVGNVEGYMSSNYVEYFDNLRSMPINAAPCYAKLRGNTALKEKTNGFSGTVADLPKGAVVRVLADAGNWLHVSIPNCENNWRMQPDEVAGYVKKNAVVMGFSTLQLDWLLPDE